MSRTLWVSVCIVAISGFVADEASRAQSAPRADVVAVRVDSRSGSYRFLVSIRSPDVDCSRYASWWEILRADGTLAYRRILMHSHPDEQPFSRAGGPVTAAPDEMLVVRAHLHPHGYGGAMFRGSIAGGFEPWKDAPADFAPDLAGVPPLPKTCWH